jgi:arylsulfatase
MPSLFTSRYPSQLTHYDFPRWGTGATVGDVPTLQQRLSAAGYRTLGVHSNPLLSEAFGFDRGFDCFHDSLGSEQLLGSRQAKIALDKLKRIIRSEPYAPADELTDVAIEMVEEVETEPFFLWVHYMDVHGPYKERDRPPILRKFLSEWRWQRAIQSPDTISDSSHRRLKQSYKTEVRFVDRQVGRLLDSLEENGYREDTLVAYTADHGEEFREHGDYAHGHKPYDELVHVPLVVSPPEKPAVSSVDVPVPLLDVTPTFVDAGGGSLDGFDGEPLPEVTGGDPDRDPRIVSEAEFEPTLVASVRTDRWKYVLDEEPALYDLENDPEERDDVLADHQAVGEKLRETLASHVEASETTSLEAMPDRQNLEERLERLGYM